MSSYWVGGNSKANAWSNEGDGKWDNQDSLGAPHYDWNPNIKMSEALEWCTEINSHTHVDNPGPTTRLLDTCFLCKKTGIGPDPNFAVVCYYKKIETEYGPDQRITYAEILTFCSAACITMERLKRE